MAKARNVAASSGGGAKQVTLPAVARQQMHAVRSVADRVEQDNPGAIHAVHFSFSGKRLQGTIVYNRNRGTGDMQQGGNADEATPPAPRRPTKPGQRTPKGDKPKDPKCSDKSRAAAGNERADEAMGDADEASAKASAAKMRKYITEVTTEVVRALGGDSVTGGQYLCPDKTPLTLFGQQLRAVRIPKGSPAADMQHEELWKNVEQLHGKLDTAGDLPEAGLRILRKALTPKAEKPPVPTPAATATAAATHRVPTAGATAPTPLFRPAASFMTWSGPQGAAASSSSPPTFGGPPRPSFGG